MTTLDGRVAVITGAGRGIGASIARLLASRGARVVINDLGVELDGSGGDAGPASAPLPSSSAPRSLTTTRAPREASRRAIDAPMPRPAPVMTATRPSNVVMPTLPGEGRARARR